MEHIAIMRKSWGLTRKILEGSKTIESRWFKSRHPPWGRIREGETVYFKDSGEPVSIKAEVEKVIQLSGLTPVKVSEILEKYGGDDGIKAAEIPRFYEMFRDRKYCMLIFLRNPIKVEPFKIDKSGFGAMCAWIVTESVEKMKSDSKQKPKAL